MVGVQSSRVPLETQHSAIWIRDAVLARFCRLLPMRKISVKLDTDTFLSYSSIIAY